MALNGVVISCWAPRPSPIQIWSTAATAHAFDLFYLPIDPSSRPILEPPIDCTLNKGAWSIFLFPTVRPVWIFDPAQNCNITFASGLVALAIYRYDCNDIWHALRRELSITHR